MNQYQPYFDFGVGNWIQIKDGNPLAMDLFKRHYSKYVYKDGRQLKLFVGPGEKLVLISTCGRALFVWRKYISNEVGVNCAVFRNESDKKSSELINEAVLIALKRWPDHRLFTYVNPFKIKSVNPGYCFKLAGFKFCGITKSKKLHILELLP